MERITGAPVRGEGDSLCTGGTLVTGDETVRVSRCGCVPQISLVYEDIGKAPAPSWARRIPLFGPLWCVSGATGTRVRRRDNAVYRSNSFKYERKSPNLGLNLKTLDTPTNHDLNHRVPPHGVQAQDLRINLNYSDPQDAAQLQGSVNQAFTQDEAGGVLTKVRVGGDIYYCRPYQPFHTQLRYNFSDLQETGVDNESEYEEMPSTTKNNNRYEHDCAACVTVISVCPSPARGGHCASRGCPQKGISQISTNDGVRGVPDLHVSSSRPPGSSVHPPGRLQLLEDPSPPYENLSFHKVTINVPDKSGAPAPAGEQTEKRNIQRAPPLRKSKVPLKYQGIKRVKSKGKPEESHEKMGYSQKEVWNWLYLEEAGGEAHHPSNYALDHHPHHHPPGDPAGQDSAEVNHPVNGGQCHAAEKGISVQFSPTEFLSATSRLAHLDLEGFEKFVGSTFDRAIAGAKTGRTQSSDLLGSPRSGEEETVGERDTDTYVWRDSCRTRQTCDSCIKSGVSSCSSALSSLESAASKETASSRESDSGHHSGHSPQHYIKMTGRSRNSIPNYSSVNKPMSAVQQPSLSTVHQLGHQSSHLPGHMSSLQSGHPSNLQPGHSSLQSGHVPSVHSSHPASLPSAHPSNVQPGHTTNLQQNHQPIHQQSQKPSVQSGHQTCLQQNQNPNLQPIYQHSHLPASTHHNPPTSKPYQTLEVTLQDQCGVQRNAYLDGRRGGLELVDTCIQLHQQEWYHGNVSRTEAENALRLEPPGSYLVRNCESANRDYSLSLKSSHGFMHMRIQQTSGGQYILGQFSRPFPTIPHMINYYTINRLPIKGAEHVSLKKPLCEQLL